MTPLDNTETPLSSRLNADKLHMVPRGRAAQIAHAVLEGARNVPGHEAMAGIAMAFAAVAPRYANGAEELFHIGRKILEAKDADHGHDDALVDSLKDFAALAFRYDPII